MSEPDNSRIYSREALLKALTKLHKKFKQRKDNIPIVIGRSVIPVKDISVINVEKKLDDLNKKFREA